MLYQLIENYIYDYVSIFPIKATYWGIKGYDDIWGDISETAYETLYKLCIHYLNKIKKIEIVEDDYFNFVKHLNTRINEIISKSYYYDLNSYSSTFQIFIEVLDIMNKETVDDWLNIVSRLEKLDFAFQQYIDFLRKAIQHKKLVSKRQILAVIDQAFYLQKNFGKEIRDANNKKRIVDFKLLEHLTNKNEILQIFIDFLLNEYLPCAPDNDSVGRNRYLQLVEEYFGEKIELEKSYLWGFEEINRTISDLNQLSLELNKSNYINQLEIIKQDNDFYIEFNQFINYMSEKLYQIIPKLKGVFMIPKMVRQFEIKKSSLNIIGEKYILSSINFDRKGKIFYWYDTSIINLYDKLSIIYHEGIPGHHFQLTKQISNKKLSLIDRLYGYSSFMEGFAHYTEQLIDELNLYSHPYYRFGYLMNVLFRACRVVIDIGIHLKLRIPQSFFFHGGEKWNAKLGEEMLTKIVGLSKSYSIHEINRYCGIPGQAITYALGKREILELRNRYVNRKDELKEFHEMILSLGSPSLKLLRNYVKNKYDKKRYTNKMTTRISFHDMTDEQADIAIQIENLLEDVRESIEKACYFTSQLELVKEIRDYPEVHEFHIYGLFPMSYHITTATGSAKFISNSRKWNFPQIMLIIGCTKNTIDYAQYLYQYLDSIGNFVEEIEDENISNWATRVVELTDEQIFDIEPICWDAIRLLRELVGEDDWKKIVKEGREAHNHLECFRIKRKLDVTSTIGITGLGLEPAPDLEGIIEKSRKNRIK